MRAAKPLTISAGMVFFWIVLFSRDGLAQMIPEPVFKTTPPKREKVVSEDQYFFTVREYAPPVKVKFVKRTEASYQNPELAVISLISAMASKDFGWYRSIWTSASQGIMDQSDKTFNQTPDFWIKLWDKGFKNKRVELTHRVETGEYVFIAYKLVPEARVATENPEQDIELQTVFRQEKGEWLATQELAQDPVLLYWRTPNYKVNRVIRGIR